MKEDPKRELARAINNFADAIRDGVKLYALAHIQAAIVKAGGGTQAVEMHYEVLIRNFLATMDGK